MTRPRPTRAPTDRELGDMVRHLARLCLEAERGLRPVEQFTKYMDPLEAVRFRRQLALGRFDGGPIQPNDVGPAHLTRYDDGTVFATVVTRTEGRRWGALSLKLRQIDQRWQISDIHRLLAASRTAGMQRAVEPRSAAITRARQR